MFGGAENVKILGRGTVVYDGPQDPNSDTGWMHRPNWHVIVMDRAHGVQISGITCVVRSRTWMIQMLDSGGITFENVKVVGGDPANANQDGMDWLGGGDTVVRDCFIRASDDIFALYGNWLGYSEQDLTTPGHDVKNIRVENSVLSTSISNVVRVSWPQKIFNSAGFVMRNSDVIHMGSAAAAFLSRCSRSGTIRPARAAIQAMFSTAFAWNIGIRSSNCVKPIRQFAMLPFAISGHWRMLRWCLRFCPEMSPA